MKTGIIVVCIVVAVMFLGGAVNIGGAPVFGHIDNFLGVHALMNAHRSVFFFLHKGQEVLESESERAGSTVNEFQERPVGIDNKGKYRQLDEAAQ